MRSEASIALGHQAMNAATYFRREVPGGRDATEAEAALYVVAYWRSIDAALGLVVPEADRSV